jgi:hypothetical protein
MKALRELIKQERTTGSRHIEALNVQDLLDTASNSLDPDMDYLGNQTLLDISTAVYRSMVEEGIEPSKITAHCEKLAEYRFVDELYQLHKGKYVRWIRRSHVTDGDGKMHAKTHELSNGGIVAGVKFLESGTNITCVKNGRFMQYRFDECLTYQKLSDDEQMMLTCYEMLRNA